VLPSSQCNEVACKSAGYDDDYYEPLNNEMLSGCSSSDSKQSESTVDYAWCRDFDWSHAGNDRDACARIAFFTCDALLGASDKPVKEPDVRPILLAMLLLITCGYGIEDVASVLAVALVNTDRNSKMIEQMGSRELAYVYGMHIFLAHTVVLDQFIPLRHWHEWVFSSYCSFPRVQSATRKLFVVCGFRLIASPEVYEKKMELLTRPRTSLARHTSAGSWGELSTCVGSDDSPRSNTEDSGYDLL